MAAESDEAAGRLAVVLVEGDRADLRDWIESALPYFVRLPAHGAGRPGGRTERGQAGRRVADVSRAHGAVGADVAGDPSTEARMRFELCRLQMHHYMWGTSPALFDDEEPPVDLFTEIWWTTLKEPLLGEGPA